MAAKPKIPEASSNNKQSATKEPVEKIEIEEGQSLLQPVAPPSQFLPEQFLDKLLKSVETSYALYSTLDSLKHNEMPAIVKDLYKFSQLDKITTEQYNAIKSQMQTNDKIKNEEKEDGEI